MVNKGIHYISPPDWPTRAATIVRRWATVLRHSAPIHWLQVAHDEIYGNKPKVVTLSEHWAKTKSSSDRRAKEMSELSAEISTAAAGLVAFWEGSAYDTYQRYATLTASQLGTDGGIMDEFHDGLDECVTIIYDTYSNMVTVIGDCAIELLSFGMTSGLYAIGDAIPGVNLAVAIKQMDKAIATLETFGHKMTDLLDKAIKDIGKSTTTGLNFQASATKFVAPGDVSDGFTNADNWHVRQQSKNPTNGRG